MLALALLPRHSSTTHSGDLFLLLFGLGACFVEAQPSFVLYVFCDCLEVQFRTRWD